MDFFRSFSYPTAAAPSSLPDASAVTAHIEESCPEHNDEPSDTQPSAAATAAIIPSTVPKDCNPGGLTLETDDSVSDVSPSAFPHIIWEAAAFGQADFPEIVECLMDTGANLNLIRPETAADLGLTPRRLRNPIPAGAAFDEPGSPPSASFTHYVTLSLSSRNLRWNSRTLRAVVAPNLCSPIILGLPFFVRNKILLDPEQRTAIHKETGVDLLNEDSLPLPPPPKAHRLERRKKFRKDWKMCIQELKEVCAVRLKQLESQDLFEKLNYVAAIRGTIEILASQDANNKLAAKIVNEYNLDVFEPIPHADLLPTDVLAHLPLKDDYKPMKTRKYSVPRMLRPKFEELIDLRLHQGFIQPSSSHFSSPSFVVPKAYPTALPRWVGDYRQLNKNTITDLPDPDAPK